MQAGPSTATAIEPEPGSEPARSDAVWDSSLARCVATLLIANSHLEAFYPRSWLAADGLLGNTMFFMVSGIGLTMRNRARELSFFGWYLRRVLRIYPSLWVCIIGLTVIAGGAWAHWSPFDYVHDLVWPTTYAFVRDIMVYYALAYVLLRAFGHAPVWAVLAIAALSVGAAVPIARELPAGKLAIGAIPNSFWLPWWLLMFLIGMLLPRLRLPALSTGALYGLVAGSFVLYVALKYAMVVGGTWPQAFVLLFIGAALVAALMILASDRWIRSGGWLARGRFGALVRTIGERSLEVYLTHVFVGRHPAVVALPFPLNLAVFAVGTAVLSEVTFRLASRIRRRLEPT